ncbi:serine protease [Variovorax sp. ZT4R33]|uniref:serine protease n=1 Tax=Variovorax sp. ZT4R33 TaxID=3443743 RepID=UPI003F479E8F
MQRKFRMGWGMAMALSVLIAGCGAGGGDSTPSGATGTSTQAATSSTTALTEPALIASKVQTAEGAAGDVDPFKDRPTAGRPVPRQVLLPALPTDSADLLKSAPAIFGIARRIGVARPVADTSTTGATTAAMGWSPAEDGGKSTALRFSSPGAKGVRLGLRVESLPPGTMVRFYGDADTKMYEISAHEILTVIQRNLDAGDTSDNARIYWSPNLGGEALTIEIQVPANAATAEVRVAVPLLSHVSVDIRKSGTLEKVGEAGSCNLDVSCTTQYDGVSKSAALMDFMKDGANYVCTGTLLNDRMSTGTPYFLSANHCISNQTVASTLFTLWFYRSASCNSTQVNPAAVAMTSGATLLYAAAATDTSFMRLNSQPPAGAVFAGSSPFGLGLYDQVYGVHHPHGDLQKYSVGTYLGTANCSTTSCISSNQSNAGFHSVTWSQGVTESGSSGSGLFQRLNGNDYLVGQLLGGSSACSNPIGPDVYGRFDLAFNASLQQWLNIPSTTQRTAVYRFYNKATDTHFYTSSVQERDLVITKMRNYNYEGPAFFAFGAQAAGTSPVHRFFNTRNGTHFYTINDQERAQVQASLPWYQYEGVTWYANTSPTAAATPMFRFYRPQAQTHFYTINASERDIVQQTLSQYQYEGVAYFGWTGP